MILEQTPAQVLVVGAGPVGLTLAAELTRQGVRVRIIDENSGPVDYSRAVAIHARTLEIFADMGVIEPVLRDGRRIHGASIYDGPERILHFDLDELDSPYRFTVNLPQSQTERILLDHLAELGVTVERQTTLTGFNQDHDGIDVYLHGPEGAETVRVPYLAGCDGAQSTVRHTLGMHFAAESRFEDFLLADAPLSWEQPDDEWTIWFHEDGLLTVFPLPGGLVRIVADNVPSMASYADLLAVWSTRAATSAKPGPPVWISAFRAHYRRVSEYRSGRVFVAGDSAHVHSPAGGQGMNTGIQDAFNLAWKLSLALRGVAAEGLLDSYTAEREPIAHGVVDLTGRMNSIATLRHPVSQAVRDRLCGLLTQFEVIEQRVVSRFGETAVNYRTSPICRQVGHWYGGLPHPGDRAPRIQNILHCPRFKVLAFTAEQPTAETREHVEILARYIRDGYGDFADFWTIARAPLEIDVPTILDADGTAHHRYAATVPCVYVIRPDNYVGFRSLDLQALPVLGYLGEIFDAEPKAVASD